MAGLYLVGAWLVLQVADTLLPVFDAPAWAMKAVVVLLTVGFGVALVFSWIFELTPEGLKREVDPGGSADTGDHGVSIPANPRRSRRLDGVLVIVVAAALGYFAIDRWTLPAATSPERTEPAADPGAAADSGDRQQPTLGIAVLPFANLSADPENAFFAGGVYEEVLTKLSRIDSLRVISRTSMEHIARENLDVGAIGQRLGVSHVLAGSVRRDGDRIRITAQLVETRTDQQVWAENYDRQLKSIFAIQSEIALAIAEQLEISLSAQLQASLKRRPTRNPAAYALYLRAMDERRRLPGVAGFQTMIDLLEPAIEEDARFLEARVLLADAYGRMSWFGADPVGLFADKARRLIADLAQRWPDHPQSQLAQGQLLYNLERDYAGALAFFEVARARLPNDPAILRSLSGSYKRLDRSAEFLDTAGRLLNLDPESPGVASEYLLALLYNGLLDDALAAAERDRARFAKSVVFLQMSAFAALVNGDSSALLQLESAPFYARDYAAIAHFVHGDVGALLRPVEAEGAEPAVGVFVLAERVELLRLAGRNDAAQALMDQARADLDTWLARPGPQDRYVEAWINVLAANVLALAGDAEQAGIYLSKARRKPPRTERYAYDVALAAAQRRLGKPDAAWRLIEPWAGRPQYLSTGELNAFRSYYDQLYGDSPTYRAHIVKLRAAPR